MRSPKSISYKYLVSSSWQVWLFQISRSVFRPSVLKVMSPLDPLKSCQELGLFWARKLVVFRHRCNANVSPLIKISHLSIFLTSNICDTWYKLRIIYIMYYILYKVLQLFSKFAREWPSIWDFSMGFSLQSHQCMEELEKTLRLEDTSSFLE